MADVSIQPSSSVDMDATDMLPAQGSSVLPLTTDSIVSDSSLADVTDTKVYSSYNDDDDDSVSDSTQFPMQHATQLLPGAKVTMTTTDPITITHQSVQSASASGTQTDGLSTMKDSVGDSVTKSNYSSDSNSVINTQSTDQSDSTVSSSVSETISAGSSVSSSVSSRTSVAMVDNVDSTDELFTMVDSDILPSSSTEYSGELYGTPTPSKTTLSSATVGLDTVSLRTTEAVPLTPLSSKPLIPDADSHSTILGGGLSDYIIYIAVPLCGLALLIFLIVCIICIRRRKAKKTSSPAKNRVQDLWVNNSRSDIPMTSQNNAPDPNGGEAVMPGEDIAKWQPDQMHEGLRKRRSSKKDVGLEHSEMVPSPGLVDDDEGCTSYEAVFDFKAEQSTHLSLKQGDHVRVNRKETAGWWRGTVGDQTGWFPSNYVQPALQDNVKTENEIQMHDDSHVTSFMVKSSHEANHRQSYLLNEPNHRKSTPTEEEIEAEPIYCKIQPKDKRKSGTDRSSSTTPTKSQISLPKDSTDGEISYEALYPFVARVQGELTVNKGDIILCRESDGKNGWMKGKNDTTKEEGYVPTTYVKKIDKQPEKIVEKTVKDEKSTTLDPDPYSYKQLEVNTNTDDKQDLVGIIHKAVHTFTAEKAGDLEFETGDFITVFQVLENGWWLGCKDKTVGWFPGSFVEMLDHPSSSSSPSPASSIQSPSESPVPSDDYAILNEDNVRTSLVSEPRSKLKPVRKAPPPPTRNDEPAVLEVTDTDMVKKPESKLPRPGGSKLPKMSRPKVAPPQPPCKSPDESPLYDTIDKTDKDNHNSLVSRNEVKNNNSDLYGSGSDGLYDLIKEPTNNTAPVSTGKTDKVKPPVPKRYIKPKLVTIPRTEVQLPDKHSVSQGLVNGDIMRLRSPPPPRPAGPKLGPIRAKLSAPKPLEDQIPNEEDNTYFHVTPQRKFDTFIRQESGEQELEVNSPYKSLSSFGSSSFGSTFGKPAQNKNDDYNDIRNADSEVNAQAGNVGYSPNKVAVLPVSAQVHLNGDSKKENTHVSNNNDVLTAMGDNVVKDNLDLRVDKNIVESPKDISENEFKPKSSIPVTPKSKGSRLQPPKSVSNKDAVPSSGATGIVPDVDQSAAGSPIEKTTKLPKSKIPHTPKESPRSKHEESNVFQYPENSYQKGAATTVDESTASLTKDNSIDANMKYITAENDDLRPRAESIGKPPVAPKPKSGLPKPKTIVKKDEIGSPAAIAKTSPSFDENLTVEEGKPAEIPKVNKPVSGLPMSKTRVSSESENEGDKNVDDSTKAVTPVSKIPMGSAIPHQSPGLRGRKSNIPSPGIRTHSTDRLEHNGSNRKKTNSECESPVSPVGNLRQKPESPAAGRKGSPLHNVSAEQRSLRNRSNSPAGRTGIPTTVRNRSNSPAPKSPGIPVPKTGSPKLTPKNKTRGLVPPKKIHNGQETPSSKIEPETNRPSELPGLNSQVTPETDSTDDSLSPKPDRPSKPPRVQKKKSPDGKPPKHGKSLLPVIHKSMESGSSPSNGVSSPSPGTKPKRGIPVAKSNKPPGPKSPPVDSSGSMKKTLYQALRAYTAQNDGELSFTEGTFVKELSDCDRPGWYVGMLADGTTGLYPADCFKPSPVSAQSEA